MERSVRGQPRSKRSGAEEGAGGEQGGEEEGEEVEAEEVEAESFSSRKGRPAPRITPATANSTGVHQVVSRSKKSTRSVGGS